MTGYVGKTVNKRQDVVGQQAQSEREAMWGPIPGEIVSYDAAKGTAEVKPLYKPRHNGKAIDMPNLIEVPVDLQRTANAGLTFPIPAGTRVMLTPAMRSMEKYEDQDDGEASDARSFSLSDMRATIAGGNSLSDPMKDVDPDNTHLRFDVEGKYGVRGSPDGKIKIEGSRGNIYDLLATVVELLSNDQLQINHGSSTGTGHELQFKAQYAEIAAKLRAMQL
ncbi:MAG: hypothetical protein J0H34_22345 [Rhizobiales bacterium]|nr:hypothetical protein [Hyphomicrobiales bacterium]